MNNKPIPIVLSIAGSDCSGGAGIQADIKTMISNGVYAASVITVLTAQNTQGVQAIHSVPTEFIAQQLKSVFSDLSVDAVKVGMLHDKAVIDVVADALQQYKPKTIVLDPVMIAKGGAELLKPDVVDHLKSTLFALSSIITPNLPEAEKLTQQSIQTKQDMQNCAEQIAKQYHTDVLIKGGHFSSEDAEDIYYDAVDNHYRWFTTPRINSKNTHGTGCTLSSAIAANLAKGLSTADAIQSAKRYLNRAIQAGKGLQIGSGHGPVHHAWGNG